ncbi:hypothetical protein F5Y06DRAFT_300799 [Hypoxylon sp. FL0890]|nr:hypothetical protein F5Y06DRAFT_300799 [Hypoxylon sp. FL0890]
MASGQPNNPDPAEMPNEGVFLTHTELRTIQTYCTRMHSLLESITKDNQDTYELLKEVSEDETEYFRFMEGMNALSVCMVVIVFLQAIFQLIATILACRA